VDCQSTLYVQCEQEMVEKCETDCRTTGGAIFCNGQFVSTNNIDACAAELAQEIDVHVEIDAEVDADVDVDVNGPDCAVANVGAGIGGNGPGGIAGGTLALIGLASWLRRRARNRKPATRTQAAT
jgi:hypothetical protein